MMLPSDHINKALEEMNKAHKGIMDDIHNCNYVSKQGFEDDIELLSKIGDEVTSLVGLLIMSVNLCANSQDLAGLFNSHPNDDK